MKNKIKSNFYFLFIILFITLIQSEDINYLVPIKGIIDIKYNSEILSFSIPLDTCDDMTSIELSLSEPYKSNRDNCKAECSISSKKMNCQIKKEDCDLLEEYSIITIESIIYPPSYDFNSYELLSSTIFFNATSIEMICSNFKLSFFFYDEELKNHPYNNFNFSFPIFYQNKEKEAICILPKNGKYIPCVIDATKILFKKDYSINFDINSPIQITDDLNISLTNIKKYKLEDDCGKDMDNYASKMNYFGIRYIMKLFCFLCFIL